VRYVPDAILKVPCLTTQSSAKISDTVALVLLDSVSTDICRQIRY
jgi:hypothetical protein